MYHSSIGYGYLHYITYVFICNYILLIIIDYDKKNINFICLVKDCRCDVAGQPGGRGFACSLQIYSFLFFFLNVLCAFKKSPQGRGQSQGGPARGREARYEFLSLGPTTPEQQRKKKRLKLCALAALCTFFFFLDLTGYLFHVLDRKRKRLCP